jgi:hypothetical protein
MVPAPLVKRFSALHKEKLSIENLCSHFFHSISRHSAQIKGVSFVQNNNETEKGEKNRNFFKKGIDKKGRK